MISLAPSEIKKNNGRDFFFLPFVACGISKDGRGVNGLMIIIVHSFV